MADAPAPHHYDPLTDEGRTRRKKTGMMVPIIASVFLGNDFDLADKCSNHAELKVLRYANPPAKALLSVGVSRPICVNCQIQLDAAGVDCIVPRGTSTKCVGQ